MPIKRTKQKIHQLRQEPEHIRIRKATYLILIIAAVLAVIYLFALIPIQVKFARDKSNATIEANIAENAENQPRVGGIQDTNSNTGSPSSLQQGL